MDLSSFAFGSSVLDVRLRQDRDPESVLIEAEEFKEVGSVPRPLTLVLGGHFFSRSVVTGEGRGYVVIEVLQVGFGIPFLLGVVMKGRTSFWRISSLLDRGAVELATTSPGFFPQGCLWSRSLLEPGDQSSISPSVFFCLQDEIPHGILPLQSCPPFVGGGDWMFFLLVLLDAYL